MAHPFAPVEEVSNKLSHGEYLLLDTRPSSEHSASRIPSTIPVPPPISISDYSRVPSLIWVGLYCVSDDQQQAFATSNIRAHKVLVGVSSKEAVAEGSWPKRLYDLIVNTLNPTGGSSDIIKAINEHAVRFVDLGELAALSPVMFCPVAEERLERWHKPASIILDGLLYLSSMSEAINHRICGPNGYLRPSHIINASNKDSSNVFESLGEIKYLNLPINDSEETDISKVRLFYFSFLGSFPQCTHPFSSFIAPFISSSTQSLILYATLPTLHTQHFDTCFHFIEEARTQGTKCLVHCAMGISRAPSITIYYVMRHKQLSLREAYDFVKARRPEAFPNRSFMLQLIKAESELRVGIPPSMRAEEVGKIGGLASEYKSKTPTGVGGQGELGPVGVMCDATGKCFVM